MRISDWSSDVCSSDLVGMRVAQSLDGCVSQWALRAVVIADVFLPQGAFQRQPQAGACGLGDVHEEQGIDQRHGIVKEGIVAGRAVLVDIPRSEEHTSELQSLMRISYAVFCLKKKKNKRKT